MPQMLGRIWGEAVWQWGYCHMKKNNMKCEMMKNWTLFRIGVSIFSGTKATWQREGPSERQFPMPGLVSQSWKFPSGWYPGDHMVHNPRQVCRIFNNFETHQILFPLLPQNQEKSLDALVAVESASMDFCFLKLETGQKCPVGTQFRSQIRAEERLSLDEVFSYHWFSADGAHWGSDRAGPGERFPHLGCRSQRGRVDDVQPIWCTYMHPSMTIQDII